MLMNKNVKKGYFGLFKIINYITIIVALIGEINRSISVNIFSVGRREFLFYHVKRN
jgi:hypothetical protein